MYSFIDKRHTEYTFSYILIRLNRILPLSEDGFSKRMKNGHEQMIKNKALVQYLERNLQESVTPYR